MINVGLGLKADLPCESRFFFPRLSSSPVKWHEDIWKPAEPDFWVLAGGKTAFDRDGL